MTRTPIHSLALLLLLPAAAACQDQKPAPRKNPLTTLDRTRTVDLVGTVTQRLRAGSYTYVEIVDARREHHWLVTLGDAPAVGSRVKAHTVGSHRHFESRRLERSFDRLWFGWAETQEAA